VGYNWV